MDIPAMLGVMGDPVAQANTTSLLPSVKDLLLAFPRLAQRAGSLALRVPEQVDNLFGFGKTGFGQTTIAEATNATAWNTSIPITGMASPSLAQAAAATASAAADASGTWTVFGFPFSTGHVRNMSNFFTYLTSKWAITTLVIAVVLNRTQFYASSRVPLNLRWYTRLALHMIPILLFVNHILYIAQALHCQTSPQYSEFRYGDMTKRSSFDFAGEGGALHRLASWLVFWQDNAQSSCRAIGMVPVGDNSIKGSMSLLWPLFMSFALSQFMETLACALEGRQLVPENGMTLFEHSLAFAETELAISNIFQSIELNAKLKPAKGTSTVSAEKPLQSTGGTIITRSMILSRINVPPELLLICLVSSFSHFSTNILAVIGKKSRYRLLNTGVWGVAYIVIFLWSMYGLFTKFADDTEAALLRFPSVCIIGFLPHVGLLIGMVVCALIYGLALLLTAISIPHPRGVPLGVRQRLALAYQNLQANAQLASHYSITIRRSDDFYSTLLKIGFNVLTSASEAVFLNEGSKIRVANTTWLENKRYEEIVENRRLMERTMGSMPSELKAGYLADGVGLKDERDAGFSTTEHKVRSGYAIERKARGKSKTADSLRQAARDQGVGMYQRRGRWALVWSFAKGNFWLTTGLWAKALEVLLRKAGVTYRPAWLRNMTAQQTEAGKEVTETPKPSRSHGFLVTSDDGRPAKANMSDDVDVEEEHRKELMISRSDIAPEQQQEVLDSKLYDWWKRGGWWGEVDSSGDYIELDKDDDTTSVVSMATTDNEDWYDDEDGQRTPTQERPFPSFSREPTPADDLLDHSRLASLLNPRSTEEQHEARLLARHLQHNGIMTRSRYKRIVELDKSRVLTSSRHFRNGPQLLTSEEEELALERYIIERRSIPRDHVNAGMTWDTGAQGSPSGITNAFPIESTADEQLSSTQHGRSDRTQSASPQPYEGSTGELPARSTARSPARDASSPTRDATDAGVVARLNAPKTPSPPPGSRIADYESATPGTPSGYRSPGPQFQVIHRPRKTGDRSSAVQKLPNEILANALSHLSPNDLAAVSLVSRRFHQLVTTPHAWRVAFSRYFPGADAQRPYDYGSEEDDEVFRSERRSFTRLTTFASWRSEYIVRTRLLRSLARGKPMQAIAAPSSTRSGISHTATATVMYNSNLFTTVNHLHATFGTGLNKRAPRFIHGADDVGTASSSDPSLGKIDAWGATDFHSFLQFFERFPGDPMWGLGSGDVVGNPNVMDVSQPYGMVLGEGYGGGMIYYRHVEEMRGRFLPTSLGISIAELGVPKVQVAQEGMSSVWMAKSSQMPSMSEGLIGILVGSSTGILTSYSLGSEGLRDTRVTRGELTARWVLSPGVPIIAIAVDDSYSLRRQAQNRIWAMVLNALGEVYYLTKFPKRAMASKSGKMNPEQYERLAWETGRSVYWNLIDASRRVARPNPYDISAVDGSYSPRSSWNGMCLSREQVKAETHEIEAWIQKKPKDFRKTCLGWDMRRRLEVDFAGDDGNHAGESALVIDCGLDEGFISSITRYTRCKFNEEPRKEVDDISTPSLQYTDVSSEPSESLFGGPATPQPQEAAAAQSMEATLRFESGSSSPRPMMEEWRSTTFALGGLKGGQITTSTIDMSTFAVTTISEDPALGFSGMSNASSPSATPSVHDAQPASPADLPGQRARFMAIGTKTGSILLWDARASIPKSADLVNTVDPIRIIHTDSPQISCLALSALQLVHGGNDGLVQAWDPLASTVRPIRTLNSRFSSRARRRLVQAQATPQGVGINMFAAGAICLDPDPTVLRGMVSLGAHLRYWSYSSSAADQYKSSKRRLRRSERGSNNGGERFAGTPQNNLKHYIASEKYELERETEQRRRDANRLAGRFGTELLGEGASDEDMLAYARMLSEESMVADVLRRQSHSSSATDIVLESTDGTLTPELSVTAHTSPPPRPAKSDEELEADIAEAIRLSLEGELAGSHSPEAPHTSEYSLRFKPRKPRSPPRSPSARANYGAGASNAREMDDLEFALQLSMVEEDSRKAQEQEIDGVALPEDEAFPGLPSNDRKGKGRAR